MPGARVGILSDTHGNLDHLARAIEFLACFEPDAVCHLGDDYADADLVEERGMTLYRVPGIYSPLYAGKLAPKKLRFELGGRKVVLVHSADDLAPADYSEADLVLHGHTHRSEIRPAEGVLILNPGHLKAASHKGREASFGLAEMDGERVRATVFSLQRLAEIESLEIRA